MLINLLYAAGVILAILAVLAVLDVITVGGGGWVALAIAAGICLIVGYFLSGPNPYGRR